MHRTRLALLTMLAAALVVVASASAATPTLNATSGPGFSISMKKGGKKLTSLKAGKVKIVVKDLSNIHNFHLIGPGLNKKTSVSFSGEKTWTIKLKPGKYTYQCDVHLAQGMKGTFKVTK